MNNSNEIINDIQIKLSRDELVILNNSFNEISGGAYALTLQRKFKNINQIEFFLRLIYQAIIEMDAIDKDSYENYPI